MGLFMMGWYSYEYKYECIDTGLGDQHMRDTSTTLHSPRLWQWCDRFKRLGEPTGHPQTATILVHQNPGPCIQCARSSGNAMVSCGSSEDRLEPVRCLSPLFLRRGRLSAWGKNVGKVVWDHSSVVTSLIHWNRDCVSDIRRRTVAFRNNVDIVTKVRCRRLVKVAVKRNKNVSSSYHYHIHQDLDAEYKFMNFARG